MLQPIPSNIFSVDKAAKMFIVEDSTLLGNYPNMYGRIFPDACDKGFRMVSQNTGQICDWVEREEVRDREDELEVTIFEPTREALRRMPQLKGWTVHVLND